MTRVYILHAQSADRYCVGMTKHLRKRLKEYLAGQTRSTLFAKEGELAW